MSAELTLTRVPRRGRFGFRFRLSTLLLAVTAACVWLGIVTHRARQQQEAVAVLHRVGAVVSFDYQFDEHGESISNAQPTAPAWARRLFGEDYFRRVVDCTVWEWRSINDEIRAIVEFRDLRTLRLHGIPLSREHLDNLATLHNLTYLELSLCPLGDVALAPIAQLTGLTAIELEGTGITDKGLADLARVTSLEYLGLKNTQITDDGVAIISRMAGVHELGLDGTRITSDALRFLAGMPSLVNLHFERTAVDDAGLKHLHSMVNLQYVGMAWTKASASGRQRLEQALPDCIVDDCITRVW